MMKFHSLSIALLAIAGLLRSQGTESCKIQGTLADAVIADGRASKSAANGDVQKAFESAESALCLARGNLPANDVRLAGYEEHLGSYANRLDRLDHAHKHYMVAAQLYRKNGKLLNAIQCLTILESIDQQRNQVTEAIDHARQVTSVSGQLGESGPFFRMLALDRAGVLLHQARRFEEASAAFEQARHIADPTGTELPLVLEHYGALKISLRKYNEAVELLAYAQLRAKNDSIGSNNWRYEILDNLALAQVGIDDVDSATSSLRQAFDLANAQILEALRRPIDAVDESKLTEAVTDLASQIDIAAILDDSVGDHDPALRNVTASVAVNRVGVTQDLLSKLMRQLRDDASVDDQESLARLFELRTELAACVRQRQRVGLGMEDKIRHLSESCRKIESALLDKNSSQFEGLGSVPVDAIRSQLNDDTVLLQFARYSSPAQPPRYRAFAISKGGISAKSIDGSIIDSAIESFRYSMLHPEASGPEARSTLSRELGKQLWDPVEPLVEQFAHMIVVPDAELSLVPFDAIKDRNNKFLAESRSITYLSSARNFANPPADLPGTSRPVVFVNPAYDEGDPSAKRHWAPLPKTEQIAESITKFRGDTLVFSHKDASPVTLRTVKSPQFLHIASHAFFDPPDLPAGYRLTALLEPTIEPMLVGGIALAGANRPIFPNDGIVSPLELADLDLRGTKLVFISGCSTAAGTVRNAEGIYGIRRGLELAGSRAQILALWDVGVTATNDFVIAFYKHWLGERKSVEAALHETQAEFRTRSKDPFDWAAFVLSGREVTDQR